MGKFETGLLKFLRSQKVDFLKWISDEDPKFKSGENVDKMKAVLDEFASTFA